MFHKRTSLKRKPESSGWNLVWAPGFRLYLVPACLYHPPAAVLMLERDFWLQSEHRPLRPLHLAREDALWTVHSTRSLNKVIAKLV